MKPNIPDKLDNPEDAATPAPPVAGALEPDATVALETPVIFEAEALDLVGTLSLVDETAYVWDLITDKIEWESNAPDVLGVATLRDIGTGGSLQNLIAPEHAARRHEICAGTSDDPERGVPYRVQYKLIAGAGRGAGNFWVEDIGRWWPGKDGKPRRARGVLRIINERYFEEQRMLYPSDHDELTGQLNRARLTDALGSVISRSERQGRSSAFLVAGIANLASINETFGYDIGDEVIAAVARVIKEKLRGGDTMGRYSSNKFGIILGDCGGGAMEIAAERFMAAVRAEPVRTSACQVAAMLSIGGVIVPDQAATVSQALSSALQALDQAKQKRVDSFAAYTPCPNRETKRQRNMIIAGTVMSAISDDRMRLVMQPIVDAKTRAVDHYECLLRMEKPGGGLVAAGEFVAVAEQVGLARHIDARALELAVGLLRTHSGLRLAINVSSLTTGDTEWLQSLSRLTASGKRALTERLTVEITETTAIHDMDQCVSFVDTLKGMGCSVSIDDFGAGYTSFKNLKHLKVDVIKIDGAFVKDLSIDLSDQVFIRTMVELARSFHLKTVAEWVGDEATAVLLTNAGIDYLQGFLFGQPLSSAELARALHT